MPTIIRNVLVLLSATAAAYLFMSPFLTLAFHVAGRSMDGAWVNISLLEWFITAVVFTGLGYATCRFVISRCTWLWALSFSALYNAIVLSSSHSDFSPEPTVTACVFVYGGNLVVFAGALLGAKLHMAAARPPAVA